MENNKSQYMTKLKDWTLPAVLVVIAIVWSAWVVTHPVDSMVAAYLTPEKLLQCLWQHVYLVMIAAFLAVVVAVPLGVLLTRPFFAKFCGAVTAVINVLQAIPSFAVIALLYVVTGIGIKTAVIAIWVYSLLPILNNTIAGIRGVDLFVVSCARGMGMTNRKILFKVEMPLAFPVVFAGIRTAVVVSVGTAVIATFIGAGGLGDILVAGKNTSRYGIMILAAGLSSILALLLDSVLGILEKRLQ